MDSVEVKRRKKGTISILFYTSMTLSMTMTRLPHRCALMYLKLEQTKCDAGPGTNKSPALNFSSRGRTIIRVSFRQTGSNIQSINKDMLKIN